MKNSISNAIEFLHRGWFLILFIGGVIYWAGQQSVFITGVAKADDRITALETRTNVLENGIGQLKTKIDSLREDVGLIKTAVIK